MIRALIIGMASLAVASAAFTAPVPLRPRVTPMAGLWEVSQRADGHGAQRVCLTSLATLVQWEHRNIRCGHNVLSRGPNSVVVDYNCGPAGFGHSRLTIITPRTLKVETQGISANFPFQYQLHARRVGTCPPR